MNVGPANHDPGLATYRGQAFKLGDCDQKQASPPSCSMVGTSHMSSQCSAGEFLEPDAPFDSIASIHDNEKASHNSYLYRASFYLIT